ncbi:hypothetical protein AB0B67_19380, partial [Streptomyces spectabilis]
WLTALVRNREYGELANLRRGRVRTNAHIRAGSWVERHFGSPQSWGDPVEQPVRPQELARDS